MKRSSFYKFMQNGKIDSIPELKNEIGQYINQSLKNKDTSYIYSDMKKKSKNLDSNILIRLLELYIESIIGEWDLEYFLNWIEMSDYELTNRQAEVIFIFSTPEINYPITKNNIKEVIKVLKEQKDCPIYMGKYSKKLYKSMIIFE